MQDSKNIEQRVARLVEWYGDGADGATPTAEQWRRLLSRQTGAGPTLINFFKLRDRAVYGDGSDDTPCSGEDAFQRYAAVSVPTLEKVGGHFLLRAAFESDFIGESEDWDIVAVGAYPNLDAALALFEDPDYRRAYRHRAAACARQKVVFC